MLPEKPRPRIFQLVHMVVGNPERVSVKLGFVQIALFIFKRGIDDWLYPIVGFKSIEECRKLGIEDRFFVMWGLYLYVDDWRKVARLELYVVDKEVGLHDRVCRRNVEMVGTSDEACLGGFRKVVVELIVLQVPSLCSLDEEEREGRFFVLLRKFQQVPVDVSLVM